MSEEVEKLKQRWPLLDYLRQQKWTGQSARPDSSECVGLCPLHQETQPSFYVNTDRNLFYCHGCGQGGDLIRFVQLSRHLSFRESLAYLEQLGVPSAASAPTTPKPPSTPPPERPALLQQAAAFYQTQLDRYPEALRYLQQRGLCDPALYQQLRIGYAPDGSLRCHLMAQGYSFDLLRRVGLLNAQGRDSFYGRIVFPLAQAEHIINLYGRSLGDDFAHRFLPGPKGGLYAWEQVRQCPEVILVEGLFDYAVLWQAGFHHLTCSLGTHLNASQFRQLCDRSRTVYLTFDGDSGQQAARRLAHRLRARGVTTRRVLLPQGYDPKLLLPPRRGCTTIPISSGVCSAMKFHVIEQPSFSNGQCPIRVIEQTTGREVGWINCYLDREYVRRLANTSLRTYAYHLLDFVRWWERVHHTGDMVAGDLTQSILLDYVRFQSSCQPRPSPSTINDRIAAADRALRNQFPEAPWQMARGFHQAFLRRGPMGLGRPRAAVSRLRVKAPKPNVVPLSVNEVFRFWSSFRTSRDLAIVGVMVLQGLRSAELLAWNQDDVLLPEAQLRVRGKGNKLRFLPLAPETIQLLDHYLRLEPPKGCGPALFVVLQGPARGVRMTPAGLRSLFRYHRLTTGVKLANPHRFRHTFAYDMVRGGMSLPALMQLMGHADIQATLRYVQITPQDVYQEYARAVTQCIRPLPKACA